MFFLTRKHFTCEKNWLDFDEFLIGVPFRAQPPLIFSTLFVSRLQYSTNLQEHASGFHSFSVRKWELIQVFFTRSMIKRGVDYGEIPSTFIPRLISRIVYYSTGIKWMVKSRIQKN